MNRLTIFGMVVFSLLFSGCNGLSPEGKPETKPLMKPQTVKEKVVTFKFPQKDPITGEKIEFDFNNFHSSATTTKYNTQFGTFSKNYNIDDLKRQIIELSQYDRFQIVDRSSINIFAGLKVDVADHGILLNYSKGESYTSANRRAYAEVRFLIGYTQKNPNEIIFTYPNNYIYRPAYDLMGPELPTLATPEKLQEDVTHVFNNLDKLKIVVVKKSMIKDEVNTDYPANSVYANFDRILGKYNWSKSDISSDGIKKENTFAYVYKGKTYPIHVSVYPYRSGSKVVYELLLTYSYDSDGDSSMVSEDVAVIKNEIAKIVNN